VIGIVRWLGLAFVAIRLMPHNTLFFAGYCGTFEASRLCEAVRHFTRSPADGRDVDFAFHLPFINWIRAALAQP
jgi:hypothetical protein